MQHAFASVKDLFGGNIRYEIPPYQREYQWGPEQWQSLWRDLGSMYEQEAVGAGAFPNHFMGILLLEPIQSASISGAVKYSVIDGQQRLTTLLILQAAIRDADNEANGVELPSQHGLFWVRDTNNVVEGERLVAQDTDHEALTLAMENVWRAWYKEFRSKRNLEESRALWAYTYFRNCIWRGRTSFVDDEIDLPLYKAAQQKADATAETVWTAAGLAPAAPKEMIDLSLAQQYLYRLDVLELRIQSTDEDAPTIFESINAKRTELQQWDFIRNLIFTRFDADQATTIFNSSWKEIQTSLEAVSWGGKRSNSRDAFIYDYLIARGEQGHQGSIGKNRGYQHLRVRIARELPKISHPSYRDKLADFVNDDLLKAARVWPIAVGAAKTPLGSKRSVPKGALETIESIANLSSGPPFPVVLHLVEQWNDKTLTDRQLGDALKVLETYLVRMVLCKRALSPLRALFMGVMNQLAASDDALGTLKSALGTSKDTSAATAMPSDQELRLKLKSEDYYRSGLSGSQLGAIFRGIERQMSGAAANPLPYGNGGSDFTVEHVFPQSCVASPHGAWADQLLASETADAMGSRVNKLGNLTLLTFDANRYLRAKGFVGKKAVFRNRDKKCPHPMLSISQAIQKADRWSPKVIDNRTLALSRVIVERWPADFKS